MMHLYTKGLTIVRQHCWMR